MKKNNSKNRKKVHISKTLIFGIALLILYPAFRYILGNLIVIHCPSVGGIKECGLQEGLMNASVFTVVSTIWLIAAIFVTCIGLYDFVKGLRKK